MDPRRILVLREVACRITESIICKLVTESRIPGSTNESYLLVGCIERIAVTDTAHYVQKGKPVSLFRN